MRKEDFDDEDSRRGESYHEPVLLEEVLDVLEPAEGELFLDGTLGGGGHARALLERCATCRIVGVDRDPEALDEARGALAGVLDRVELVHGTFDRAVELGGLEGKGTLSGALLDLGVSSHQLDEDARGFAFRRGVPLDMRMERTGADRTAAEILNEATEAELTRIFRDYGEEPRARKLAREIVRRRTRGGFSTSDDLVNALAGALGKAPGAQDKARIFQALRIEVNDEMGALERALESIRDALGPGERLAVVAYHSLEDRMVKHSFREWSRECVCPPGLPICVCRGKALGTTLTRRPVRPGEEEIARNPRARSARLRA